jgi:hypothetical protein
MEIRRALGWVLGISIIMAGCSSPSSGPSGSPTANPQGPPSPTIDATGTAVAQITLDIKATRQAANATEKVRQAHLDAIGTANSLKAQESATAEAMAQMETMRGLVEQLAADGHLTKTEGTYYRLPDFYQSWAQIDWFQWWDTGYNPTDFVVRADMSWSSASDKANWWNSGCGFVFRSTSKDNLYMAHLALDGHVYLMRVAKGIPAQLGGGMYGKVGIPDGSAEMIVIVEGKSMTFLINGKRVLFRQDTANPAGALAFTLVSGTNVGYGTRCKITNVDLWDLD